MQLANLRTNSHHNLKVKRTNSKAGGNAFDLCGPRLWNSLPENIRNATNSDKFKKLLKTAFLRLLMIFNMFFFIVNRFVLSCQNKVLYKQGFICMYET